MIIFKTGKHRVQYDANTFIRMLTVTILFICQIKSSLYVLLLPNSLLCDLPVVVVIHLARIVVDYAEYVGLSILIF